MNFTISFSYLIITKTHKKIDLLSVSYKYIKVQVIMYKKKSIQQIKNNNGGSKDSLIPNQT